MFLHLFCRCLWGQSPGCRTGRGGDCPHVVLQTSSSGWYDNANDLKPYVEYTLGIILKAYRELESRVEGVVHSRMSKADRIRNVFKTTLGKVSKRDILAKCPDISTAMVEMTLKAMLDEGTITKIGGGRSSAYVLNGG